MKTIKPIFRIEPKKKGPQRHVTFKAFQDVCEIIINTDHYMQSEVPDLYNEWYELYRGTNYYDVIEWALFHFAEVNSGTHDFWLDRRGLMIYQLKGMIAVSGIFSTF